MSYCKNYRIICDRCGIFISNQDAYKNEHVPFGSKDWDGTEPLDPMHLCKKCAKIEENILVQSWRAAFDLGATSVWGDWQKGAFETRAAKRCGLVWISSGTGRYSLGPTKDYKIYCYVTKSEYDRLRSLE